MQVEPGESDVSDVVPFLEMEEIWCDEGFTGGVLDPVRSRFVGHGHGCDEAVGRRKRSLSGASNEGMVLQKVSIPSDRRTLAMRSLSHPVERVLPSAT